MKPTHIILTRPDGSRIELTIDEARAMLRELEALLGPRPVPVLAPLDLRRFPGPPVQPWITPEDPPTWTSPHTGDPLPVPPFVVTCEARPQ